MSTKGSRWLGALVGGVRQRRLITLAVLGALLCGACSTRLQQEPSSPPVATPSGAPESNPSPATPAEAPGTTTPAQAATRPEPPVVTPAPGAVSRTLLPFSDVAKLTQPGLMLLDVQSGQVEFWTLAAGAADRETGIVDGSYHTADGRFILLKTWDQRRFLTDRATGETWTWSTQGWREVEIQDQQLLLRRETDSFDLYALHYADRSITPTTPPSERTDVTDWSAQGLGPKYDHEAGLPALLITDRNGAPQYRIRNSLFSCSWFGAGSSDWLADGSALVVGTYEGTRLLRLSGEVVPLPYEHLEGIAPSPTDANLIAYLGRVAGERSLTIFDLSAEKERFTSLLSPNLAVDLRLPRWHPSGRWFQLGLHQFGSGYDCEGIHVPLAPKVDRAPFPAIQYQVQKTGDCLVLHNEPDRLAPALTCLPDGTILTASAWDGAYFIKHDQGGAPWLHVSVDGRGGWVIANEGFITWAP